MKKLAAFWALLRAGKRVADPALWKSRQITVTALTAALVAALHAAQALGLDLQIDSDTINEAAVGIIALVNVVLTLVTTNKIGVDGTRPPPP